MHSRLENKSGYISEGVTRYSICMRHFRWPFALFLLIACALVALADIPKQTTPYWAYCVNPASSGSAMAPDNRPRHVPGSDAAFTSSQIADMTNVPDWHPAAHPAMPGVVAHGRRPDFFACAYCHLPNGEGHPESASLAGLAASYIITQIADFRSGARKSSEPTFLPALNMTDREWKASDQEIAAAADYFSKLERKPWIRVVETSTVPKTHVAGWMLVADTPAATEPIGQRIIETPENFERAELHDDTSGFVAYVPEGSIKRGKLPRQPLVMAKCSPALNVTVPDCGAAAMFHQSLAAHPVTLCASYTTCNPVHATEYSRSRCGSRSRNFRWTT